MCKKLLALVLTVSLLGLPVPSVRADDSDIFGANVQPNVLVAIDTSGSMDDEIGTPIPYADGTTYPVSNTCLSDRASPCETGVVYRRTGSWWEGYTYTLYASTVAEVTNADARTALNTAGYWSGRISGSRVSLYKGNYLNFNACDTCDGMERKIDIAKRVMTNLVESTEGVRFGLMRFTDNASMGDGGGKIIAPIGSSVSDITTAISGMDASGYTPLGEMLRDAGKYYKGLGDYYGNHTTTPIELECQPNFVILISDGLQNGDVDVRTEATLRRTQDHHSTFAGTQNVLVHTIGFAVAEGERTAANAVLQTAATNGGGTFYSTDNSTQLEAALQETIRQIVAATFAFATPVIPTTSATGVNRTFMAAFQSDPSRPYWRGYLKAFNRTAAGQVVTDANGVPIETSDCFVDPPTNGIPCLAWEAGQLLNAKAAADRVIYTMAGGSRVEFKTSTSDSVLTPAMLGVTTTADRDKIIDFVRGVDTYDEDVDANTTEQRAWKLGDIFHSTPTLVTPPITPSADSSYKTFKDNNASRTTILLAGSNDGMLHAFRQDNGQELWAFIPPDLLGNLKLLNEPGGEHPYFVDGNPIVADVKIGGTWKTIAIFGERRGGRKYHALDITDTTNPSYLWSFTDTLMGETWSNPIIGKVLMDGGTEKYVAFVGGGYDTASNNATGKAVFAIDVADGTKLWEYSYAAGSDKQYMNFSIPADVTATDLNMDGYIDRLYVGDVAGQVWKFDLSPPATLSGGLVNNWAGKRVFAAPLATGTTNPPAAGAYYPAQAIYGAIMPAFDEATPKNLWIYFGAGDRNHPNSPTAPNRFYGIKENTGMTQGSALTEASLVDITSTSGATISQGWFYRLGSTEKILASALIFNKIVYFTSFIPTTTTACSSGGGTASIYAVHMLSGYAALDWSTGAELTDNTDATVSRGKTIGTGIPTRPIMMVTEEGATVYTSVIAATTSQQLPTNPAPSPSRMRGVLYWREIFN
jgi:type IV pilus assembly protein PilY1